MLHIIECPLDRAIPFVEWFVIPYLLWFAYIGFFGIYFMLYEKETFCDLMLFGMIGMTLFLFISCIYPNGLELRPHVLRGNPFCIMLIRSLYETDTPTNVLPSIHVYNSVAVCIAIWKSRLVLEKYWVRGIALFSTTAIILSTMFIKQHSVIDVCFALILSGIAYHLVYETGAVRKWKKSFLFS